MIGKVINIIKGLVTNKEFMNRTISSIIYSLIATLLFGIIFNHLQDKFREI
jgi:hypothetical protein